MQRLAGAVLVAALVTGCSESPSPESVERARAGQGLTESDLAQYRRQLEAEDWAGAAVTGRGIVQGHPGSAAAEEVQRTLADVEARAQGALEEQRLAELWSYQTGTEAGGAQSAASIFASAPSESSAPDRLVLRRHVAWGESAYLYAGSEAYTCQAPCTLILRFDGGAPESWKATQPSTGEPALFIDEKSAFIARIADARRLEIDVQRADGTPATLAFEVGGFDPSRWPQLPEAG